MATIVDFDDLKVILDLEKTSFADYPDLELIADSVHAALENFTQRSLSDTVVKVTETGFNPQRQKEINLKNLPIVSIESVTLNDYNDGIALDLTLTEVKVNPYGVTLPFKYEGAWTVTTKGGFKGIPSDSDIYRAELFQITYEYQNKNNMAATGFTNDGGGVTLPGFVLLPQVKQLLAPYIHVSKMGY